MLVMNNMWYKRVLQTCVFDRITWIERACMFLLV